MLHLVCQPRVISASGTLRGVVRSESQFWGRFETSFPTAVYQFNDFEPSDMPIGADLEQTGRGWNGPARILDRPWNRDEHALLEHR